MDRYFDGNSKYRNIKRFSFKLQFYSIIIYSTVNYKNGVVCRYVCTYVTYSPLTAHYVIWSKFI